MKVLQITWIFVMTVKWINAMMKISVRRTYIWQINTLFDIVKSVNNLVPGWTLAYRASH